MDSNVEKPNLDNFSIQDTMEMGAGDSQLLNDLMAPETSTEDVDNLEEIVKETSPSKPTPKKPAKVKEISGEEESEEGEKKEDPTKSITDFLSGDEEEEEEISSEKTEEEEEEKEKDSVEPTQYSALASDLFELGIFTKDEGEENVEIKTPEEFLDRWKGEKQKGAIEVVNNFIGQFGEDYQQAFDAIYVKGVNPKDYFSTLDVITGFKDLDLTVEDNQIKVMRQTLADQGFESDDIETEIERLKNYGDLETVATKHNKVLIKREETRLQQQETEAQAKLQQKAAIKNQYVTNVQQILSEKLKAKEFDGIPINPKLANELHDFLLVDKYKTTSGETLTDFDRTILELKKPENHSMKVKLGLLLKILEKDPTLSTIQKTGLTKKSDQIFGSLAKQVTTDKTSKVQKPKQQQPARWFQ